MATRGRIGILRPDGRVESIYNHYDSYPEGLGEVLKRFKDQKEIDELIALGNRSGLYVDEDWRNDKEKLYNEPSRFYNSEDEFYNDDDEWIDYKYLYKDGAWNVYGPDESAWGKSLRPLVKPSKFAQQNAGTAPNLRRRFKSPLDQANSLLGGK